QIFAARFERARSPSPGTPGEGQGEGSWIEREPAQLASLTSMLTRAPRPVHLLGEGIPFHEKFITNDPAVIVTSTEAWLPRASVVTLLGSPMARSGQFIYPDHLLPIYIRKPEAEEKLESAKAALPR